MVRGYAAIGLVAPKCDRNVGGALRAAMCYDAALIAIQGARYQRKADAKRTDTNATYRHIPVIEGSLRDLVPHGCMPIAVEITDKARSLVSYHHPERGFYIFGPEDGSIPPEILAWCQSVVKVPTAYCMNLAATVNVVLYDRLAKHSQILAGRGEKLAKFIRSTAETTAARPLRDSLYTENAPDLSDPIAWAALAHEDARALLQRGGGDSYIIRLDRACGILFARIEELEKKLYPISTSETT